MVEEAVHQAAGLMDPSSEALQNELDYMREQLQAVTDERNAERTTCASMAHQLKVCAYSELRVSSERVCLIKTRCANALSQDNMIECLLANALDRGGEGTFEDQGQLV